MKNWRDRFNQWMIGRYGMDELGTTLTYGSIIVMVLSVLFQSSVLNLLVYLMLAWELYRCFSKNLSRRYEENQKFLQFRSRLPFGSRNTGSYGSTYKTMGRQTDRDHKIYRCPSCGQKVRVPRGRGKISIHCPKCSNDFVKRT